MAFIVVVVIIIIYPFARTQKSAFGIISSYIPMVGNDGQKDLKQHLILASNAKSILMEYEFEMYIF